MLPAANRMSGVIAVVPWDSPLVPTHVQPPGMITAADTLFPLKDTAPASKTAYGSSASVDSFWGSEGASEQAVNFRASGINKPIIGSVSHIVDSIQTVC